MADQRRLSEESVPEHYWVAGGAFGPPILYCAVCGKRCDLLSDESNEAVMDAVRHAFGPGAEFSAQTVCRRVEL